MGYAQLGDTPNPLIVTTSDDGYEPKQGEYIHVHLNTFDAFMYHNLVILILYLNENFPSPLPRVLFTSASPLSELYVFTFRTEVC